MLVELKYESLLKKLEKSGNQEIKQAVTELRTAAGQNVRNKIAHEKNKIVQLKAAQASGRGTRKLSGSSSTRSTNSGPKASTSKRPADTTIEGHPAMKKPASQPVQRPYSSNGILASDLKSASKSTGTKSSLFQTFSEPKPEHAYPKQTQAAPVKESFMEILASMTKKPAVEPIKETPLEAIAPETSEEKKKRLHRESRRHIRVVFEREATLTKVHLIENRDELQAEHNSYSEVQDVADVKAEGQTLRRQVDVPDEIDDGTRSAQDMEENERLDKILEEAKKTCNANVSKLVREASSFNHGREVERSTARSVQGTSRATRSSEPESARSIGSPSNAETPTRKTLSAEEYIRRNPEKQRSMDESKKRMKESAALSEAEVMIL